MSVWQLVAARNRPRSTWFPCHHWNLRLDAESDLCLLDLLAIGTFLMQGRMIFLVLAAIIVLMVHELICREERFLREHYGDAYREYCARVGRYVPGRATYE